MASRTYAVNGRNQYTTVAGVTHAHDLNGNLTSDGSRSFGYDAENRLTNVSGSASLTLAYDPLGRLRQTTAGATTDFLYDGDRLIAEYNGSTLLRRYAHGSGVDEPIVWYEGATLTTKRWLHPDERGSIVAWTDGSANATVYRYGPYGEPAGGDFSGSRFRYTGQIALREVSLYHYKARVYDPITGRFLQTDPVGYEDDLNLYAYTNNDAINKTDPSGECLFICSGVVGALVGGAYEFGKQQLQDLGSKPDWGKIGTSALKGAVVGIAIFTGGAGAPLVGATEAAGIALGGGTGSAAITAVEGGSPSDVTTSFLAGAAGASGGQVLAQGNFSRTAAQEIASRQRAGTITEAEAVFARGATVAGQRAVTEIGSMVPEEVADAASAPAQPSNKCQEKSEKC